MRFKLTNERRTVLVDATKTIAVAGYVIGLYQAQPKAFVIGTVFLITALVFAKKENDK